MVTQQPFYKILLVDDSPLDREAVAAKLKAGGLTIDEVYCAQDAITQHDTHNYNLILMDFAMPGMDGLKCTEKIRAREKNANRVIIIGLSGNSSETVREQCLEAGMDDFLHKDTAEKELGHVIKKMA
ncbi:MAG: response regulator [Candidatus Obscuribacterales bacterium]|nr:response regulator [Candidatus Obscuribacterales bacterium]